MSSGPFVTTLDLGHAPKLRANMEEQGFEMSQPPHTLFAGKKPGLSCTLYSSGKLVVQGKNKGEFIEFFLEPEVLEQFGTELDHNPRIGCDEAGKGDYFGPLVVAGVFADEKSINRLVEIGVKDSKAMKDDKIIRLAREVIKICPYDILRLHPPKYNELYEQFRNLNTMLAWAHSAVIETLHKKTGCQSVIVDQFANKHVLESAVKRRALTLSLVQRTKGESDVVVAAASLLARAAFVKEMDELSHKTGLRIPKGASSPRIKIVGQQIVERWGHEGLRRCAKLHFKTTQQLLD
jgi:ribonuclease HIII